MNRKVWFSRIAIAAVAIAGAIPALGADREGATLVNKGSGVAAFSVEGPRPMATAVQSLIQNYGYRISYEDPRYVFADDLEDVTAKYSRIAEDAPDKATSARLLVPKGGKFAVDVQPSKGAESVLRQTILAAGAASPGQRFQVRKDDDMLHVVPTGVRDRSGNQAAQSSVLDTLITLPAQDRTAYETIVALCSAITSAAGVKVEVGMTGFESYGEANTLEPKYSIGAEKEPARIVLKRVLDKVAETRELLTWMLLFGNQSTDNAYALNLFQVPRPFMAKPAAVTPSKANSTSAPAPDVDASVAGPRK